MTSTFKEWFGPSVVTESGKAGGEPIVVYHGTIVRPTRDGTMMGDIQSFDRMFTTRFRKPSIDTVGSWFSTNPGDGGAEMYAGGGYVDGAAIYPVYLSIKNPQVTTFQLMTSRARKLHNGEDDGRMIGALEVEAYRKWLRAMGKDGIKIEASGNDGSTEFDRQDVWIALEPEQIKSAIGNNGKYRAETADIRFSIADGTNGGMTDPTDVIRKSQGLRPGDESTPDVAKLQTQLTSIERGFEELRKKGVNRGPQWDAISQKAGAIRVKLFELTGDYYGKPRIKVPKPSDEALETEYRSPDEVPADVRRWVQKNANILTSSASDAVRWGRICDTLNDDRYSAGDLTIFRAVAYGDEIRAGDWVTTDEKYAVDHLARHLNGKGRVLVETVDGRDVLMSPTGNDEEAIFAPRKLSGPVSNESTALKSEGAGPKANTELPAFLNWFSDSKVVDATGRPLVVYHGTAADFESFDNSKTGANDRGLWGRGHYFSAVAEGPNSYALRQGDGARVIPAYVSIKSPLVLKTGSDLVTRLPDGTDYKELVGPNLDGAKIKEIAISGGHDGVIQIRPNGLIGDVVAFHPEQIKSAIGNNGDFNRLNADIRFSASETTTKHSHGAGIPAVRNPSTVGLVQSAVTELLGGMELSSGLGRVVVTTAAEIKTSWEPLLGKSLSYQSEGPARLVQGFEEPATNTVFLIADNIERGAETAVAAHEFMHKHGKAVLGAAGWARLHGILNTWASAAAGTDERAVYSQARAKVETVGLHLSSEEMFPYAVEAAIKMGIKPTLMASKESVAGWLGSVKLAMQRVWEKVTGNPETLIAQDLVDLAYAIAQMENPRAAEELVDALAPRAWRSAPAGAREPVKQTDTAAFADWFEDSKVIKPGTSIPMPVYHGTGADTGNEFRPGTYFTARSEVAHIYATAPTRQTPEAGPNLAPVYLSMQRPYLFDASVIQDNLSHHVLGRRGSLAAVNEKLAAYGFDGIILKNTPDLGGIQDQYVIFSPNQVKSSIGNNGNFDPASPDVRYSFANEEASLSAEPDLAGDTSAQTFTPAFDRWFGPSKVVNPDGSPKRVFHGTMGDFNEFEKTLDIGFHFGTVDQANEIFGRKRNGRNIIPAYLSIRNPLRLTGDPRAWMTDYVVKHAIPAGILSPEEIVELVAAGEVTLAAARAESQALCDLRGIPRLEDKDWMPILSKHNAGSLSQVREVLESKGFDGLVYVNKYEGKRSSKEDSWVAFRSSQIKSTTGNNLEYDSSCDDIRFSVSFGPESPIAQNQRIAMAAAETMYTELSQFAENKLEKGCTLEPAAGLVEVDLVAVRSRPGEDTRKSIDSMAGAELMDFRAEIYPETSRPRSMKPSRN